MLQSIEVMPFNIRLYNTPEVFSTSVTKFITELRAQIHRKTSQIICFLIACHTFEKKTLLLREVKLRVVSTSAFVCTRRLSQLGGLTWSVPMLNVLDRGLFFYTSDRKPLGVT